MKKIIVMLVVFFCVNTASAQTYQGQVDFGYAASIADHAGRILLNTVHGVRFNDAVFAGIGVGVNFHHQIKGVEIPIYLNGKYYFQNYGKVTPLLSLDLGGYIGTGDASFLRGFTTTPGVGIAIRQGAKSSINFLIGYNYQSSRIYGGIYDAVVLKLGYAF